VTQHAAKTAKAERALTCGGITQLQHPVKAGFKRSVVTVAWEAAKQYLWQVGLKTGSSLLSQLQQSAGQNAKCAAGTSAGAPSSLSQARHLARGSGPCWGAQHPPRGLTPPQAPSSTSSYGSKQQLPEHQQMQQKHPPTTSKGTLSHTSGHPESHFWAP
jgi:hypothetical protein